MHVCATPCKRTEILDPLFDVGEPKFEPWPEKDSPGFTCTISRGRQMQIQCTGSPGSSSTSEPHGSSTQKQTA